MRATVWSSGRSELCGQHALGPAGPPRLPLSRVMHALEAVEPPGVYESPIVQTGQSHQSWWELHRLQGTGWWVVKGSVIAVRKWGLD